MKCLLIVLLIAITNIKSDKLTEDYYLKLIKSETEKAINYQLSEQNVEFQKGFMSNKSYGNFEIININL